MSNHAIIGRGNLGQDLYLKLTQAGHQVTVLTRSEGFDWDNQEQRQKLIDLAPECVWYCVGAGSVEFAETHFDETVKAHVLTPLSMIKALPNDTRFVLFSTDYVADEETPSRADLRTKKPRSLYALSKIWLEEAVEFAQKPNQLAIVRVGTLYGRHYPSKTFPGRVQEKFPQACEVMLPTNFVVPTLTSWIAEVLVKRYDALFIGPQKKVYHLAPSGGVSVLNWGKRILGADYKIHPRGLDTKRPEKSGLSCTFFDPPNWEELWSSAWHLPDDAKVDPNTVDLSY